MFNVAKLAVNCRCGLGKPQKCGVPTVGTEDYAYEFPRQMGKLSCFQKRYLVLLVIYSELWKLYCDIYSFWVFHTFLVLRLQITWISEGNENASRGFILSLVIYFRKTFKLTCSLNYVLHILKSFLVNLWEMASKQVYSYYLCC